MRSIGNRKGSIKYKEPRKMMRILKKRKEETLEDHDGTLNSADGIDEASDDQERSKVAEFNTRRSAVNALTTFTTVDLLENFPVSRILNGKWNVILYCV